MVVVVCYVKIYGIGVERSENFKGGVKGNYEWRRVFSVLFVYFFILDGFGLMNRFWFLK